MKYLASILFGLVLVSSASVVQALGVGTSGTININADVSAHSATTSSRSSTGASENAGGSGTASTNASDDTASTNAKVEIGSVLHVTRADVTAKDTSAVSVSSPASVQSKTDLSSYASGVVKADTDVSDTELSDAAVSLGYKQRAKLFGFIPIFVNATATVHASGETTVSYPWYTLFTTTDSASLQSDVKTATKDAVAAGASGSATLSASTQAALLAKMHDAMKAHLQQSLAAEAKGSVSTK